MNGLARIERVHAWIVRDTDDTEGIVGAEVPGLGLVQLMCGDQENAVKIFQTVAEKHSREAGQQVTHAVFSSRSDYDAGYDLLADPEFQEFAKDVREGLVPKMDESAMVVSLVTPGTVTDPDVKFAIELGMSIMMDKPIIAISLEGAEVPPRLKRVAEAVIKVSDVSEIPEKLERVAKRLEKEGVIPPPPSSQ